MPLIWLFALLAILSVAGYVLGRRRAIASAGGDRRALHSLPNFYGLNVALTVLTPALAVLLAWLVLQPIFVDVRTSALLPEATVSEAASRDLVMADVTKLAPETARVVPLPARGRPQPEPEPRRPVPDPRRRKKKRKGLVKRFLEEAFDVIEDIFD